MNEQQSPDSSTPPPGAGPSGQPASVGRDVVSAGRDVVGGDVQTAGRDIAGRDIVTTTTTHVGLSAADMQRLLITLGVMLIITFTCGFSGGILVGNPAFAASARQVAATQEAADEMNGLLEALKTTSAGTPVKVTFSEKQLSCYFFYTLGPKIGLAEAQARLLEAGRLVVTGRWAGLGNLPIMAVFRLAPGEQPFQLESAAIQILNVPGSTFGWIGVPTPLVQALADQLNASQLGIQLGLGQADVRQEALGPDIEWTLGGVKP